VWAPQLVVSPKPSLIRIDGHPVASLDFSSIFLQLLYAMKAKVPAPEGDLYEGT
jgi:hypothetical protein